MTEPQLTGEQYPHKIAAIFDGESVMRDAAERLSNRHGLDDKQIVALSPDDRDHLGRALLPDAAGIRSTIVRAHVWLGLAGFVAGLLLFAVLRALDVRAVVDNPVLSVSVLALVFTLAGLLVGGAVSVRPDQAPYIHAARTALEEGRHVLVVHGRTPDEARASRKDLESAGARVVGTL